MVSAIKQKLHKAKEELQEHMDSEGVDVQPHRDEIEQMQEVLEEEDDESDGSETEEQGDSELKEELNRISDLEDERELPVPKESGDQENALAESEVEQDRHGSAITSPGVESELDLEPDEEISPPEKDDFRSSGETGVDDTEDQSDEHTYREKDEDLETRLDRLEAEVRQHEEKMVSEESEELSKLSDLENRVENLELRDDSDLEQRIAELENRLERLESLESMEDRLTELEDQLIKEGSISDKIREVVKEEIDEEREKEKLRQEVEQLAGIIDEMEKRVNKSLEEYDKKTERLWEMIEEVESGQSSSEPEAGDVEKLDERIEGLWEEMDEEVASIESRIHDNEQELDELVSMVTELSDVVKGHLKNH